MEERKLFLESIKENKEYWIKIALEKVSKDADLSFEENKDSYLILQNLLQDKNNKEAFKNVVSDLFDGLLHSLMVTFDLGDSLADYFLIDIINKDTGESLCDNAALHEELYEVLYE